MATTLADLAANSQDKLVQGFVNEIITDDYLLGAMTFDDCMDGPEGRGYITLMTAGGHATDVFSDEFPELLEPESDGEAG